MNAENPPLIVTLALDASSQQYFTRLRTQFFPAYCNYLEAHLTLFHHLPSGREDIMEILSRSADRSKILLEITGIKNMGNGVAYTVSGDQLLLLHQDLQSKLTPHLISQDRQRIWPHITVQNKVTAYKAKRTADLLQQDFKPFAATGTGLSTWLYRDGPWEPMQNFLFA